jgi:hypothetical protein
VGRTGWQCPCNFHQPVKATEIWSATSEGYSFVISYESPAGPGRAGGPFLYGANGAGIIADFYCKTCTLICINCELSTTNKPLPKLKKNDRDVAPIASPE